MSNASPPHAEIGSPTPIYFGFGSCQMLGKANFKALILVIFSFLCLYKLFNKHMFLSIPREPLISPKEQRKVLFMDNKQHHWDTKNKLEYI